MHAPTATDSPSAPRRILLRSSWQTVNIGDVAHTPGALRALERFAPEAEIGLWPVSIGDREREMLKKHFPHVKVIGGELDDRGHATTEELREAFAYYDFMLHGSGPHAVAGEDLRAWWQKTRKPYGFFGITVDPVAPPTEASLRHLEHMVNSLPNSYMEPAERDLYNNAEFIYCRDSLSKDYLLNQGVTSPLIEFGPDATFTFDLREDEPARQILDEFGFSDREFLCLIPGLKWTPYYELRDLTPDREALRREAIANAYADEDMAALTEVIVGWVRNTGLPVLICPEMVYQVELAQAYWPSSLPDDVAALVHVLPTYWTPAVAATVYSHARAVASIECHSPIMAIVGETPTIHLRQPTDTIKASMYADLGAPEIVIEMDAHAPAQALAELGRIHADFDAAQDRVRAMKRTAESMLRTMSSTAARRSTPTSA